MSKISDRAPSLREPVEDSAKSNHTPAPLFVSAVRTHLDRQQWLRILTEADEREVAFIPFGDRTTKMYLRCMADARLYAAAPDLLAALQAIQWRIGAVCDALNQTRHQPYWALADDWFRTGKSIDAAILKATEAQP
jgi:hypothetical protein